MAHLESDRGRSASKPAYAGLNGRFTLTEPRLQLILPWIITLIVLTAWELGVRRGVIPALYFPAPSTILRTLVRLTALGVLLQQTGATLSRMFWGTLAGAGLGLALGLLLGYSRGLRTVVEPFLAAAHPVPKIAILPLIMVIFGIGDLSLIIVIATAAFFPVLINSMVGVTQIHPIHFDVARSYAAGPWQLFRRVVWPAGLPLVLTGLRLGVNMSLLVTVAVEMIGASRGLGAMLWMGWTTMRIEEIYAALFVIVVLGLLLNSTINRLTKRLVPWQ